MIGFLGITTVASLALMAVCLFLKPENCIKVLIVVAPLTSIAAVNIGSSDCILLYHIIWVIAVIKTIQVRIGCKEKVNEIQLPFLIFCFATIPLVLLNTDVMVINTNTKYDYARPSFQQITQYGYLLIAISTSWMIAFFLKAEKLSKTSVFNCLDIGLTFVLVVAILQMLLPADLVTELFRNAKHVGYTGQGNRISSTFNEPSFLSLYLIPMVGIHAVRLVDRFTVRSVSFIGISLAICLQNRSSSAVVALCVVLACVVIIMLYRLKRSHVSHGFLILAFLVVPLGLILLDSPYVSNIIDIALNKMSGEGVSGNIRMDHAALTFGVFLDHWLVGIGWGTFRSDSTLLNWMAETGIIGIVLFAVPFVIMLVRLLKRRSNEASQVFVYLMAASSILVISCPEVYYLTFWIVYGLGWDMTHSAEQLKKRRSPLEVVSEKSDTSCCARKDSAFEASTTRFG